MNTIDQMKTMGSSLRHQLWLMCFEHSEKWSCHYSGEKDGMRVEIKKEATTAEEAVDLVFLQWSKVMDRLPEFSPMLAPPAHVEETQDGDQYVTPPSTADDIPF